MKCHLSGLWSENGGYNASELRIATTLLIPLLQSWFKYQNNQQGPQFPKSSTSEKVAWDWFCGRVSRTSEEFWYACLLMTEFDVLSWLCGWFCRFDLWKGFHVKRVWNVYYDKKGFPYQKRAWKCLLWQSSLVLRCPCAVDGTFRELDPLTN